VQITADPTGLQAGLGRATGMLQQFAMRTTGILGGLAGVAAGLLAKVPQTLELLGMKSKIAQGLGLDQETLAGLERAAGHLADELPHALRHLQRELGQAFVGEETAQEKFKKWGLDPAALSSGPLKEALSAIADRVRSLGSTYAQTAMLTELFGRQGAELLPMFLKGSQGLDAAAAKAKELGLALSATDQAQIDQAVSAQREAKRSWAGAVNELAIVLAPVAKTIAELFSAAAKEIRLAIEALKEAWDLIAGKSGEDPRKIAEYAQGNLGRSVNPILGTGVDIAAAAAQRGAAGVLVRPGEPGYAGPPEPDFWGGLMGAVGKVAKNIEDALPDTGPLLGPIGQKLKDWQKQLDKALAVAKEGELGAKIKELQEEAARIVDPKQRAKAMQEIEDMARRARETAAGTVIENMKREREKMGLSPEEQKRRDLERMGASRAKLEEFDREAALTQQRRAQVGLQDFTEGLELNIAAFGKTANETKLLEMAMGNARKGIAALTEEELAQAKKLVQELAGLEVQRAVEAPWESFEREAQKLDELLAAGTISRQDYDLAITKQLDKFDKAVGGAEAKLASAATFGSAGAVSAINQFRVGTDDPQQRIQRLWERAAEQRREQIEYAKKVVDSLDQMAKQQQEEKDQIG
jgi:hypothetical protein